MVVCASNREMWSLTTNFHHAEAGTHIILRINADSDVYMCAWLGIMIM